MNILIISSFLIFKDTRFGGSKRLYYFIEELKQYGAIDLICIDGCKEIDNFKSEEKGFNYFKILERTAIRNLKSRAMLSDLDLQANRYEGIEEVSRYLENRAYDAVLIAFPLALGFLNFVSKSIENVVYIEDDLHFEKIRQMTTQARILTFTKVIKYFKYFQSLQFYRENTKRIKYFVCISDQEKEIVSKMLPHVKCQVVKYGISLHDFTPLNAPGNKSMGFIGNFKHTPNADAVHFLFESIIDPDNENWQIIIGGQNPPESFFQKYKKNNNVIFMNNLENISEFYKNIDVFVNPIVSGRGLRTKIIEAAAYGRPILSTRLGGEGLEDLEILYFKNREEFYSQLELLSDDKKKYSEIVKKNIDVVHSNYEISKIVKQLALFMKIV